MTDYPYLQTKIKSERKQSMDENGSRPQAYQAGFEGFIMRSNFRYLDELCHNYSYYSYLECKMKTKSENRLNNNLRLLKRYMERSTTQPLTLQCRNTYELKIIHEEAEKLGLKHETVKLENVYQNKLKDIQCTICDHDCGCTKTTRVNSEKRPIYGVKVLRS